MSCSLWCSSITLLVEGGSSRYRSGFATGVEQLFSGVALPVFLELIPQAELQLTIGGVRLCLARRFAEGLARRIRIRIV